MSTCAMLACCVEMRGDCADRLLNLAVPVLRLVPLQYASMGVGASESRCLERAREYSEW